MQRPGQQTFEVLPFACRMPKRLTFLAQLPMAPGPCERYRWIMAKAVPHSRAGGAVIVACRWRTCRTRSRCGIVIAIALLALFAGHTGASVKRIFAADAPTKPSTDEDVLADRPLAVWRFEEPAGAKRATAERFAAEPLPADMSGTVVFGEAGPRPP